MKNNKSLNEGKIKQAADRKPNEIGGFYFSSGVKIFDPASNEVLVQKRGDN